MPQAAHRCSVLLIDDDPEVQEVVGVALAADGYEVASASTARDGLDHLRSHADTCVVLLDLLLPDLEGAEFRRIQRRDRSLAWIPVIVMSAAIDGERIAREIGAARFVRKPLDLDELKAAIREVSLGMGVHRRSSVELANAEGPPLSSG